LIRQTWIRATSTIGVLSSGIWWALHTVISIRRYNGLIIAFYVLLIIASTEPICCRVRKGTLSTFFAYSVNLLNLIPIIAKIMITSCITELCSSILRTLFTTFIVNLLPFTAFVLRNGWRNQQTGQDIWYLHYQSRACEINLKNIF